MERVNAVGMACNQAVHEYLTFGLPLTVNTPRGQDTRNVRFFDFDHPEGRLNEFIVTTQFRVRRGHPSTSSGLEQGKLPDFVPEVASASTARRDETVKRDVYRGMGVPEF